MTKVFILAGLMMTWVVLPSMAFSQTAVEIGDYTGCSNTEMLIPLEVEQFQDIAAFTLFIGVNTENLEYVGIEDINEEFSTGDFTGGINPESKIVLTWTSITPANLDSGLLCNIRVLLKKDVVDFAFQQDDCEIARSDLSIIDDVEYSDGALIALNTFPIDPVTQSVIEEFPATIEVVGLIPGISSQWQRKEEGEWINIEDAPPYSGVQTDQLSIQAVSADMNGKLFRCLLSNNLCSEGTNESELVVTPNGVDDLSGYNRTIAMQVYPNPVDEYLNCVFHEDISSAGLRLLNAAGVVVISQQLGDIVSNKEVALNMTNLEGGMYVIQLLSKGQMLTALKVLRR